MNHIALAFLNRFFKIPEIKNDFIKYFSVLFLQYFSLFFPLILHRK